MQDFGLIDLPYPLRKLSLNPIGTLRKELSKAGEEERYTFRRGADAFPAIGAAVLLPTERQLRSIVESGAQRRVKIGTSPLAGHAEVRVDPDRIFGRHLAVLGNTGSGKSCSVAGLIRWSMEAARERAQGEPNARFIVLDPNGEYARAFEDGSVAATKIFRVNGGKGLRALRVPLWFWNSAEWACFTQASARTQRPLLKRALREVKAGQEPDEAAQRKLALRRYLSSNLISIQHDLRTGAIKTEESKFGFRLKAIQADIALKRPHFAELKIAPIEAAIEGALKATHQSFIDKASGKTVEYYRSFTEKQVQEITTAMDEVLTQLGGVVYADGPDEDVPIPFKGADFADHLEMLAEQEGVSQFVDFLIARIRTFLGDGRIRSVVGESDDVTLESWLNDYLGSDAKDHGRLNIIDLSLVPTEVVHVITAVIARMIFDALQRYRKEHHVPLPTVLVMEEAHTFVKRYKEDAENHDAAAVCCQVFEKIAREGRKFGLGMVVSSQRPSELSQTVLSQCNTFLLHRISNDRDQELVHKLVPDNIRGLLRELPTLPSQNAILLGWASELPVLVQMHDLPKKHQPRSDDPDFWHVWTGKDDEEKPVERKADWKKLVGDWQGVDKK